MTPPSTPLGMLAPGSLPQTSDLLFRDGMVWPGQEGERCHPWSNGCLGWQGTALAPEDRPVGSQSRSLAHALSLWDEAGPAGKALIVGSLITLLRPCWDQ